MWQKDVSIIMSIWKCGNWATDSWSGCSRTLCQYVQHRNSGIHGSWLWLTEFSQRGPHDVAQVSSRPLRFNHGVVRAVWERDEPALPEACASPGRPHVPTYLVTNNLRKPKVSTTSWWKRFRIWKERRRYYKLYHRTCTQRFVECYLTVSLSRRTAQWEWTVVSLIRSDEMDKTLWTYSWYWTNWINWKNAAYFFFIGFSELCVKF